MIRSESEYRLAVDRIRQLRGQFAAREAELCEDGFAPDEIVRAMQPLLTFQKQLEEEVACYERLKRGDLSEFRDIGDFGFWLIGARIASGLSQRDLAQKLGVHESSVSRDERNEYRGITLGRASQLAEVLGVGIRAEWRQVSHAASLLRNREKIT